MSHGRLRPFGSSVFHEKALSLVDSSSATADQYDEKKIDSQRHAIQHRKNPPTLSSGADDGADGDQKKCGVRQKKNQDEGVASERWSGLENGQRKEERKKQRGHPSER
jgi:hypothetical protein